MYTYTESHNTAAANLQEFHIRAIISENR